MWFFLLILFVAWLCYAYWYYFEREPPNNSRRDEKRYWNDQEPRQPTRIHEPTPRTLGGSRSRSGIEDDPEVLAMLEEEKNDPWAYRDRPQYGSRRPGKSSLALVYIDADGNRTKRTIAPYKSGATNRYFDAWCDMRQSRRTFMFGRIDHAVDLETGEFMTPAQVFQRIHPTRKVPPTLDGYIKTA